MRSATRVSVLWLLCTGGGWAQAVAGSGAVTGMILESGAEGMPDATVTVANPSLGVRRQAVTTLDGAFDIPGLPPGAGYKLKVERQNFANWESKEFEIALGQTRTFRIELERQKASTDVDVEVVSTPVVENQTGITTWVDPQRTNSLPSDRRRLDSLVALAPLASVDAISGKVMIQGNTQSNSLLSDGINVTHRYFGEQRNFATGLTQDTTQEMRVLGAVYPAEYGRAMAGVV